MNQIKSNQSQEETYTTWVWLLWKSFEIITILFINNTLFWFRLNILLYKSSGLTFWNRFGLSNYHPYSIFRFTYQCHQNKDNKNYILQNWEYIVFSFGKSTFNHFNPYQSLLLMSTNRNHHPPSFSPTLQYPISQTTHFFFLIPFIINHSIIHRLMDNWLPNINCLILCFHWFHFFSWQGIWLSILLVWNQWMNGRGERELKQQQQQ